MKFFRRAFRRVGAVLWTALSMLCIAAGILVGVARLAMPFASHLEPQIEERLSAQFGRPVDVSAVGAEWETAGPVLRLAGVRIGEDAPDGPSLLLEQAEVGINLFGWLLPGTRVLDFRVARTDLTLVREGSGRYRLEGLGGAGGDRGADGTLEWLLEQGSISLVDCGLTLLDRSRDVALQFSDVSVTLDNHGLQHRLAGRLQAAQNAGEIGFQLEFASLASRRGVSSARLYIEGADVALHRWLAGAPPSEVDVSGGSVDFRIWGDWGRRGPERFEGQFRFRDLALGGARLDEAGAVREFAAERLDADVLWERTENGWHLFGENLEVARGGVRWPTSGFTLAREPGRVRLGVDYARLGDVSDLLRVLPELPPALDEAISAMRPRGEVRRLRADLDPSADPLRNARFTAVFEDAGWNAYAGLPGITGLDGRLDSSGGTGALKARGEALEFDFPRLFRKPLPLSGLSARFEWSHGDAGWRLDAPRISFRTGEAGVSGRLNLGFQGDGTRPVIDLRGRVTGGDAASASAYLPVGIMHPDLVAWLDRALVSGELVRGRVVAYGDLDHWPFDNPMGRFEVRGLARNAVLDYREGWPWVERANARLQFRGRSMRITASGGRVYGARAQRIVAAIKNLKRPLLDLEVEAGGPAGDLLRFMRNSPLNNEFGAYMEGLSATGAGTVHAELDLPLKDAMREQRRVLGTVELEDTGLSNAEWGVAFDAVSGRVSFTESGFVTEDVTGEFRGQPVSLELEVGAEKFESAVARATMSGHMTPASLLADFPVVSPLAGFLEGAPLCQLDLTVPHAEPGEEPRAHLTLSTEMTGVAVNLPAPLAKSAAERVPLILNIPMPYRGQPLSLFYGGRLAANLHPGAEGGFRGQVRLGDTLPALPEVPGLVVEGRSGFVDLDEWLALGAMAPESEEGRLLRLVSVTADRMALLERQFPEVTIEARPEGGRWRVAMEGPSMAGSLELPSSDGAGLVADFRHLTLPEAEEDSPAPAIDPRQLPAIHMLIERFTLGETGLGRTRLEAYPVSDGLRVEMLKTESDALAIQADGAWTVDDAGQTSEFDLTITAENLGAMLTEFGYAGLVQGGQTVAHLDVSWPGAPSDFSLSRIRGDLHFTVGEGRIVPVEPGAGRIFGLLSLQALPRRLTLDFSDLFQTGLSFDGIQGSFNFSDGDAYTDDLTLSGPSALIRVVGRVGLEERDYDQQVTVLPSVGNTLPLVGALAGGPTGAAAMFVLQNIFEDQLSDLASYRYAITGSWEKPVVRQLETPESSGGAPGAGGR